MDNNTLAHYGIQGMRWGIRRFQNKDGSLTAAGKKRVKAREKDDEPKKSKNPATDNESDRKKTSPSKPKVDKSIWEMDKSELELLRTRLELSAKYKELDSKTVSFGSKLVNKLVEEAVIDGVSSGAKKVVEDSVSNIGKKMVNKLLDNKKKSK